MDLKNAPLTTTGLLLAASISNLVTGLHDLAHTRKCRVNYLPFCPFAHASVCSSVPFQIIMFQFFALSVQSDVSHILQPCSGGATSERARSNDLAGRSTRPGSAMPIACFASVIVKTENKKNCHIWPLTALFVYFDSETISAALAAFVFWGRWLKVVSLTFLRKTVHPGDLVRGCSDLEMTRLICCAHLLPQCYNSYNIKLINQGVISGGGRKDIYVAVFTAGLTHVHFWKLTRITRCESCLSISFSQGSGHTAYSGVSSAQKASATLGHDK